MNEKTVVLFNRLIFMDLLLPLESGQSGPGLDRTDTGKGIINTLPMGLVRRVN